MAFVDTDLLLQEMQLFGTAKSAEILKALTAPPVLERTIDGASTVTLEITDRDRTLLKSGALSSRCWIVVDDIGFEYVALSKVGDRLTLTFEDAVVAALRRQAGARSFPAGSVNLGQIAGRLAAEAQVDVAIDPGMAAVVNEAVERGPRPDGGDPVDSWELLGNLANARDLRRFSDGQRLVIGSDAWIATLVTPWRPVEHVGPVGHIDFTRDVGRKESTGTMTVFARRWAVNPGRAIDLGGLGPADGRWIAKGFTRSLTQQQATVQITRPREPLPEPRVQAAGGGDAGELDFLVGQRAQPVFLPTIAPRLGVTNAPAGTPYSPRAADNTAVSRMIAWALSKQGVPYVWGGSSPSGYDCSGFVMAAVKAAGGRPLPAPSRSQADRVSREGTKLSVQQALATRGALLWRMNTTPQHIAISLGDGRTVEARGRAYGCGVFGNAAGRQWTGGGTWL